MSDKAENANRREVSESSRTERRASEVGKTEVDKELPAWMEKKQQADEQFKAAGLLDKPRDNFVSGTIGRLQIEGDNGEILVKGIPPKGQERQETPVDTPSELGLKALGETDPRAQAMYEVRKGIKAHMPEGEPRDHALTIAKRTENELFQSYEPPDEMMTASDSLVAITPDMAASGDYLEGKVTRVADQDNKPIGWLEAAQKIAQLPFDKQLQVIGAGLGAGFNEYNRQQSERSIGALIGTVQGVGTIATNLGKVADFSAYLLLNDHERAEQMGAEFGEALGSSIVGGFKLFEGAHRYLNDVGKAGYQGDYTKVFRDIDNLGKQMDKAWSELPPREQARIISKLGTELAADGLIGLGAAKTAGKLPGQFTKILDTISSDAQRLHLAGKNLSDRSVRAIKEAVDDFLQPEFVTPDGQRIKLGQLNGRRSDKPDTSMLMSKADDVGSGKQENLGPRKGREIQPVDEKEVVNPIDRTASAEQKIAQLMALSEQNKPLVERFLENIDTKLGTKSEISVKTPQDILDKAKRPSIKEVKDWFDVEHVRDSFRFRTQVENLSDLPNLVEALKSSGFEIIKPDFDKLLSPKNRGWRMVALDLRAPNGQIIEYQILPREMQEAGKLEHEIYKAWRGKDTEKLSSTEKAMKLEADQEAAKLYKTAWLNYLKRTGQTENSVQQIIDETRKTMNKW